MDRWCEERQIACLYFLTDLDDAETLSLAAAHGFCPVDVRVSLERVKNEACPPDAARLPEGVRAAREADVPQLRQMAGALHGGSRFFFDAGDAALAAKVHMAERDSCVRRAGGGSEGESE